MSIDDHPSIARRPRPDDEITNWSDNPTLHDVLGAGVTRRGVLGGGLAAMTAAVLGGGALGSVGTVLSSVPAAAVEPARRGRSLLGFEGIAPSTLDSVVVPPGYTAKVLVAWGDPVSNGPAFAPDGSNSAADQAVQWGMHNDGLVLFKVLGKDRFLLVQNNEYTDDVLLFSDGVADWDAEKTLKSMNAHGVSIVEVRRVNREWQVVRPSPFARRITATTPFTVSGPAAGDPRMVTSADPTGALILGTFNNCAMGFTPWGTYLTCEENFNGYFLQSGTPTDLEKRYGIGPSSSYLWHTTDARFRVADEPNEPNRFGWVGEIDPYRPGSTPVKRTALGRLKHEGAWVQEALDGRVVVYMGDDQVFEYIYRFVSARPWREAIRQGVSPLDEGTLYVARFNEDGTGEWLPLTPENPALAGWSAADIAINTRGAADLAGATKMDRPEWIDTFPRALTAIATLTNNSGRGTGTNPPVDAANPRPSNVYGQLIRWWYRRDWTEGTFHWDLFALAGDPATADGSTIVGDKYGSPDGLYVAPSGRLWIQTDVSSSTINSGAYAGFGHNQMLCADPVSRETRRFLVGPAGCEITGVMVTPNERAMFVGIQHPGEAPSGSNDPANPMQFSTWPDGPAGGRPRSSCVVITKDDGGIIGS